MVRLEVMGEHIWFDFPGAGVIRQAKIKMFEKQNPPGMTTVQPPGGPDVL